MFGRFLWLSRPQKGKTGSRAGLSFLSRMHRDGSSRGSKSQPRQSAYFKIRIRRWLKASCSEGGNDLQADFQEGFVTNPSDSQPDEPVPAVAFLVTERRPPSRFFCWDPAVTFWHIRAWSSLHA